MQKGQGLILIIVGLVIVTVVAGGVFIYTNYSNNRNKTNLSQNPVITSQTPQPTPSPTPDETANWKSFSNSQYKISFHYPVHLNITKDDTSDDPTFLSISLFTSNPNPSPLPSFTPIPGSAAELLQQKAAKHGASLTVSSAEIYYFSLNVYSPNYDKTPHVGISRGEIERATKNAKLDQTYQDSQTQRKFIRVKDQFIDGVNFTTLKIQAISDIVIPGEQEQYYEPVVALYGENLYEFWADDKTYFDQILSTFKFTQ